MDFGERSSVFFIIFYFSVLSLPPLSSAPNGFDVSGGGRLRDGGRESSPVPEWQALTNRNFSSQIRLHPHILLMVTVPWNGESRSLMKEIAHLVANEQEGFGHLRLMVVYKNSEKLLADVLGAAEGITLFYYHHSMGYNYRGWLRAQNILASVHHVMSLKLEEIPMKPLHSLEDLDKFYQSTDNAILLLEFCGWSGKLLQQKYNESKGDPLYAQNVTENAGSLADNHNRKLKATFIVGNKAIHKDFEQAELACQVGQELNTSHWTGEFVWVNDSVSGGTKTGNSDIEMSCTWQEFQRFESFFSKFTATAREYFLPPERQSFGLISEKSLLSYLGVSSKEPWSIFLRSSWCPNCSMTIQEVDDLKTILQDNGSPAMELHLDGRNDEPAFPADRPSLILFVDRSSASSEVKGASKSSLESFRQFVYDHNLSNQPTSNSDASLIEAFSGTWHKVMRESSGHLKHKVSPASKIVKIKNNMAIMIVNEGENISVDEITTHAQVNPAYDILSHLLRSREPALESKETKISLLAKKVGFQLLSDDFEVQVVDKLTSQEGNVQPSDTIVNDAMDVVHQTYRQAKESSRQISNMLDDISSADVGPPDPDYAKTNLQQNVAVPPPENSRILDTLEASDLKGKISVAGVIQDYEDDQSCQREGLGFFTCHADDSPTILKSPLVELKEDISVMKGTQCNQDKNYQEEILQSFARHSDNSFPSISKSPLVEECTEREHVSYAASNLEKFSAAEVAEKPTQVSSHLAFVEDNTSNIKSSMKLMKLGEPQASQEPFFGSFFFSDGGYQMLEALTASTKIPSLVILDPVSQQHYLLSGEENITYSTIVNFVNGFLNGSVTPYQHSESSVLSSRESPRPPFVNLDFHETDSIPRVTANVFCELGLGFKYCGRRNEAESSTSENVTPAYSMDVLVLFSNTWCGFCQHMELIVREVYRAFKSFGIMLESELLKNDSINSQDINKDSEVELPSIYLMDCTLNDCGPFLKELGKNEHYPSLVLFPADKKGAISYEGYASVVSIIEFIISHASNSHHLNKYGGLLWTPKRPAVDSKYIFHNAPSLIEESEFPAESKTLEVLSSDQPHVVPGSILTATNKLFDAFPFNNSTILIVRAEENHGFEGLILNKPISWNVFKEFSKEMEPIKFAPLHYGGPVAVEGFPLCSLIQKAREGYTAVRGSLYFGNAIATSLVIKEIKSNEESADYYWFFLGYSSWGWNQLFDELAEGAWHLSDSPIEHLDWPSS